MPGWETVEVVREKDLPANSWFAGFFRASHEEWDGVHFSRNFSELRARDISLFACGELSGRSVLDIGCGWGDYGPAVLQAAAGSYSVVDLSQDRISQGLVLAEELGLSLDLRVGDATCLPFEDSSFDVALAADFVEHIDTSVKREVFGEVYRILKPGGVFVIKTPNLTYLRLSIWVRRFCRLLRGSSPVIFIAHTRGNPDNEHIGLTTFSELRVLLEEQFFHRPAWYPILLSRRGVPPTLSRWLHGRRWATEHIIIGTRKSLFVGMSGRPPDDKS